MEWLVVFLVLVVVFSVVFLVLFSFCVFGWYGVFFLLYFVIVY